MKKWIVAIILSTSLIYAFSVFAVADPVEIIQNVFGEEVEEVPVPVPSPVPTPGQFKFDIFPPRITDIQIQPSYNSAVISWKTSEPALSKLFWGETSEYEKGAIAEAQFGIEHRAVIIGLAPERTYHFKIEAQDEAGNVARSGDRTFKTLAPPDTTPPANVIDFRAVPGDRQVTLSWSNPPDEDFQAVKIQRSPFFYPKDPFDGQTIYNDRGEFFVDTSVQNDTEYYYTAFAYDKSGNFSSGATAFAVPSKVPVIVPPPEIFPPTVPVPPELQALQLSDFDFWQEGKKLPLIEGRLVRVKIGLPLTVSINYEKVPEVLKTIMITFEKPQEELGENSSRPLPAPGGVKFSEAQARTWEDIKDKQLFSFILRIDAEKTRYEAIIMPPAEELLYPLFATVMDFKHQARKRLEGEMQTFAPPPSPPKAWWEEPRTLRYLIYILLLAVFLTYFLWRRKQRKSKRISTDNQSL